MNFLMFVMVACLFIHTFFNSLMSVYADVKNKLSATPVAAVVSTVESVVGSVVAKVVALVKKL